MTRKENAPPTCSERDTEVGTATEQDPRRNPLRTLRIADSDHQINRWYPLKGGARTGSNVRADSGQVSAEEQSTRARAVYVLTRRESTILDSPTLGVGEEDRLVGAPVFTTREKALRYLRDAGWDRDHTPAELSASELKLWFDEARGSGINVAIVDPDRLTHLQGEPQPVLYLMEMADASEEELLREIRDLAQGTSTGT